MRQKSSVAERGFVWCGDVEIRIRNSLKFCIVVHSLIRFEQPAMAIGAFNPNSILMLFGDAAHFALRNVCNSHSFALFRIGTYSSVIWYEAQNCESTTAFDMASVCSLVLSGGFGFSKVRRWGAL